MDAPPRIRAPLAQAVLAFVEQALAGAPPTASATTLLDAADVAPVEAGEPRRTLEIGAIAAMLDRAADRLDDEAAGLHLAAGFELGALGPFSYAVLHAPTLGTALRNVVRYSGSLAIGASPRLEVDGGTASLVFPIWGRDPRDFRQLAEAAVLLFVRILRRLGGPGWAPIDVGFRHQAPADLREHRRLLGAALHFGSASERIRFAAADLDRPVRQADRFLLPIVERQLQDVVADREDPDPWRRELELQLARRICDGHPSLRAVAPRLGLSVRTLQRRLDERGLTYRRVVADVRLRLARRYLEASGPSLGEVAFLLGYSELSAFDRAYRAWTGESPGETRRRHGRPEVP